MFYTVTLPSQYTLAETLSGNTCLLAWRAGWHLLLHGIAEHTHGCTLFRRGGQEKSWLLFEDHFLWYVKLPSQNIGFEAVIDGYFFYGVLFQVPFGFVAKAWETCI